MSQPMNPYDTPEHVRPGMSGTTKVLLGMGIGCGVLVLLCCGFFGASTFWLVRAAQHALTEDPNEIRRLTDEIVAIKIPDSLPPKAGMDLSVPIVGSKFMTWVAYGAKNDRNGLFLAQFAGSSFNSVFQFYTHYRFGWGPAGIAILLMVLSGGSILDFGLLVHDFVDANQRRGAALEDVDDPSERDNRPCELNHVHVEGHKFSGCKVSR